MANLFVNGRFEDDDAWVFNVGASYDTGHPLDGARNLKLETEFGVGDYPVGSAECVQAVPTEIGKAYPLTAFVNADDATHFGPGIKPHQIWSIEKVGAVVTPIAVFNWDEIQALGPGYHLLDFGTFIASSTSSVLGFLTAQSAGPPPVIVGHRSFYVDGAQAFIEDPDVAKSTLRAFMTALKTLMEGLDPNFGVVHPTHKRWMTTEELESGGVITLNVGSSIDADARAGQKVTRFWIMQPRVETRGLTNASAEYRNVVVIHGFYQHEDGDAQETALCDAALMLIDKVNTLTTEFGTLNTGPGYEGFFERPTMLTPVGPGTLANGLKGHSVQIQVVFHEEITLAS